MLDIAISLAKGNPIKGLPRMCAILVTRKGISYVGFNRRKTHPLQKLFGNNGNCVYLHAEIDAIVKASRKERDLSGATMYVARVRGNEKEPALAKPCKGCQRALIHFNIEKVIWT